MVRRSIACAAVAALMAIAFAHAESKGVERARVSASVRVGAAALAGAQMEFACAEGKDGSLTFALILADPDGIATFPIASFEGPDGVGESRELAEWSAIGAKSPQRVKSTIGGWYGVDGDGFLLSTSRSTAKPSDFATLAEAMLASDSPTLHLRVISPEKGDALEADAVLGDQRERVVEAIAPCLPAAYTAKPAN